jgi:O-acetyl-ADP-ribose deacetylase (regulator of RNase III)
MNADPVVLGLGVSLLLMGLALYYYATSGPRSHHFQTANVIAWLLIALCPVLVIFSLFPDSSFSFEKQGATAGGAIGAFIFIWWYGTKSGSVAAKLDERDRAIADLKTEVESLRMAKKPTVLQETTIYRYKLRGLPGKEINIVTGNLTRIDFADVWANSENTNMQMASFFDRSVSGLIRYLGAQRNTAGHVIEDVIGRAVAEQMGENVVVSPGTVIVTESGDLARTHNVKKILHVAAVQGQPGVGYRQIEQVGCCVDNALQCVDEENAAGASLRSIIFPLMGTGQGRGEVERTIRALGLAATDYFHDHADTELERVFFLTYTDAELEVCKAVLDKSERLTPGKGRRPKG